MKPPFRKVERSAARSNFCDNCKEVHCKEKSKPALCSKCRNKYFYAGCSAPQMWQLVLCQRCWAVHHNRTAPSRLMRQNEYYPGLYARHTVVQLGRLSDFDDEKVLTWRSDSGLFHDVALSDLHREASDVLRRQTARDANTLELVRRTRSGLCVELKIDHGPGREQSTPSSVTDVFFPRVNLARSGLRLIQNSVCESFRREFIHDVIPWILDSFSQKRFPKNFEDCVKKSGALKFHFPVGFENKRFFPGTCRRSQVHRLILCLMDHIAPSIGLPADQVTILYYVGKDVRQRIVRSSDGQVPFANIQSGHYSITWHQDTVDADARVLAFKLLGETCMDFAQTGQQNKFTVQQLVG